MDYQTLNLGIADGIARVVLNRPTAFNALDLQMAREFCDVANRIGDDPAVRVVVITGAGERAFCAGGDVGSFAAAGTAVPLLLKQVTGYLHMGLSRLSRGRAPVLGSVNGVAAGAGLSLVSACDLAIAADTATFTSAYTKLGLTPDGSGTHFLPRLIGARRAMEMFLSNRVLKAAEALEWGLVNRVVPAAELAAATDAWARELAAGPTLAHGGVKQLMQSSFTTPLEAQMELETRTIAALSGTADGQEGLAAFAGKRKPRFGGV